MRLWTGAALASYVTVLSAGLLSFLIFSLLSTNQQLTHRADTYKDSYDHIPSSRADPRTKYSGLPLSEGQLFHLDTHFVRRRGRRSVDISTSDRLSRRGLRGVARDCGSACHLRLRSKDTVYVVHLHRWHQIAAPHNKSLPVVPNSAVAPLVVYVDDESHVHARISRTSNDCIYRARVVPSKEHSIVNLCDSETGLYGLLALPDGVYTVEPLMEESNEDAANGTATDSPSILSTRRHRPHAVHRFRSQSFLAFDQQNDNQNDTADGKTETETLNQKEEEFVYMHNYTDGTWEDLNARKARSRRSANSWDHYAEVLVVADQKMLEYHGHHLEDYILTLFSTVASIYRHQSLRASINIVVVKIVILKHENAGLKVKPNAQEALKDFCRWQQLYNDFNDESPHHHDVAILLTRVDICRARDKCDTLGLAELGTMCDRQKSCAIIEDNGLSAAFTIAHEMGHIFNIPHDDERKCGQYMQLNKANFHIMAPTLEYNTHPWSWSPCSAALLDRFLDQHRGQIQCLFDQPVERRYYEDMFSHQAPGRKYDVNQQCKFVFGPMAELCPYMPACRRLWCATYYGSQVGCRTQHMPWADGTPCDDTGHQFCHHGQCVGMAPEQRSKQDGAWGDWQPYGVCSRTCGGGIQKSVRDCNSPRPANGGKYCVGQKERYRSCNTQECDWDTPGFREVQCSEYNNRNVGIHGINVSTTVWVPKYAGVATNERCKLYCRVSGSAAFYMLKDKVVDGTACDRNGDDVCIDGTCMPAGCDHVLYSQMKRDKCGICGGDDSSCKVVKGTFNERGTFGYNEVMKIPAGSANIDIRQHGYKNQKEDDNYLSLRSADGEFLLNGHYQVSVFKQQIPIQDVVLEYSGSENVIERINGTGPIRSDIYVHVLSVGNLYPPDIRYEYMTAVPGAVIRPPANPDTELVHYYWRRGDRWSACDRICQGKQTQEIICMDATHGRPASERNCRARKPEAHTRMCNIECSTRWIVEDLSACSAACGAGQKRQRVSCAKTEQGRQTSVADSDCDSAVKPPSITHCYVDCAGRRWSYSEWSTCTETCGEKGVQRRKAFCVDGNNRAIDESHCEKEYKEQTERDCNRVPCPRWLYGPWSECSRSCGGGIRMRHAQCLDAAEREVHEAACGQKLDRETCNEQMCTSWSFGEWSECSVSCGEGKQTRDAICIDGEGRTLDSSRCNYKERIIHKPCYKSKCESWKVGEWTSCSVSCQDGWSTRRVSCVDGDGRDVDMKQCTAERPPSHKPCNQGSCPFWRTGDWSRCSSTCGKGVKERTVECIYREQVVDASFCGDSPMPKKQDVCSLAECTSWETSHWTPCSVTCGSGWQSRRISCVSGIDKKVVDSLLCNKENRPRERRSCSKDPCEVRQVQTLPQAAPQDLPPIRWATGSWGACSTSCGKGTQRRLLKCRDQYRDLPDKYCAHLEKEADTRECMIRPCANWRTGPWMPCSATCGTHVQQTRSVTCHALNPNERAEETDCDVTQRPVSVKSCHLDSCPRGEPPLGNWQTGEWSKCSLSCGGGWRRRTVTCSSAICDDKKKPKMFDQCNLQTCPTAVNTAWQISAWTSCSVTCGSGVQRRRVWCEDIRTFKVVDDGDCFEKRPIMVRDCEQKECRDEAATNEASRKGLDTNIIEEPTQWQTAPWSSCSAKCGRGTKTREVTCVGLRSNTTVASSKCNQKTKPAVEIKCRVLHCPRWRATAWSACSATCNEGVRTREVYCQRGRRQRTNDTECEGYPKPSASARCFPAACPAYKWTALAWSKCGNGCTKQLQRRRVYCVSNEGKKAAPRMCEHAPAPPTTRPCDVSKCAYEWVPGPWNTCSKTCGEGVQMRTVECRLKQTNYTKIREPSVPKEKCESLDKPIDQQHCQLNPCDSYYQWQIGPWGHCSQTCGQGVRRRRVRCEDREGKRAARTKCEAASPRPRRTQTCFERNCLPATCQEIRAASLFSKDGNYTVLLDGFPIRVYCHLMNETIPRAYININENTNFAEVYGKRLIYPHTCPYGGERNDSCACNNEGDASAGMTIFSKVRVDLLNRKIHGSDFTFARKVHGNFVPYGTAGDCYSMRDCPQGKFSLDLRGTGLRVADDIQWEDRGHRTSSTIDRTNNNAKIVGRCGGYCGKCRPDRYKGLVFEVDTKQLQPLD